MRNETARNLKKVAKMLGGSQHKRLYRQMCRDYVAMSPKQQGKMMRQASEVH